MGKSSKKLRTENDVNGVITKSNHIYLQRTVSPFSSRVFLDNMQRNLRINKNIQKVLHTIIEEGSGVPKRKLTSLLDLTSEKQINPKIKIPSIECMVISRKSLSELQSSQSGSSSNISVDNDIEYCLIQNEPDLMLSFLFLVQKTIKMIGIPLSSGQRDKIIKGIWNIAIKYWKDNVGNVNCYEVNENIEWGLLQLLNFNLEVSKKERIMLENHIKQIQKINSSHSFSELVI